MGFNSSNSSVKLIKSIKHKILKQRQNMQDSFVGNYEQFLSYNNLLIILF
jgi:hypothetical protein